MAGSSAYRIDYASQAYPVRTHARSQEKQQPPIQVVPGRKSALDPVLSVGAVTVVKVLIVLLAACLVIGFVRVGLASAAYTTASEATKLSGEIKDARSVGESLAVQKSLVANPSTLRHDAEEKLNMASPSKTESMTLPVDVVAADASGNLSFSQSVSRLAQQG